MKKLAMIGCGGIGSYHLGHFLNFKDIELAGFRIISTLLELMIDAVRSPQKAYSQLLINRVSSQYKIHAEDFGERIQAVLDYLSGMTDVFALDLYRKINGNRLPEIS